MQKDYIMRIIEQFVQALLAIMRQRKAGNNKEAVEQIKTASRYYLRADLDVLLLYGPEQIAEHFKDANNHIDTERCVLCADLLYELALVREAEKQIESASQLKKICLYLYRLGVPKQEQFQTPAYFEKISILEKELET